MPTIEDMIYQRWDEETRPRARFLVRADLPVPIDGRPLSADG